MTNIPVEGVVLLHDVPIAAACILFALYITTEYLSIGVETFGYHLKKTFG